MVRSGEKLLRPLCTANRYRGKRQLETTSGKNGFRSSWGTLSPNPPWGFPPSGTQKGQEKKGRAHGPAPSSFPHLGARVAPQQSPIPRVGTEIITERRIPKKQKPRNTGSNGTLTFKLVYKSWACQRQLSADQLCPWGILCIRAVPWLLSRCNLITTVWLWSDGYANALKC